MPKRDSMTERMLLTSGVGTFKLRKCVTESKSGSCLVLLSDPGLGRGLMAPWSQGSRGPSLAQSALALGKQTTDKSCKTDERGTEH